VPNPSKSPTETVVADIKAEWELGIPPELNHNPQFQRRVRA
jgi:hypothetical protein